MGDALVFSSEIDPASLDCLIPKISIQTLVENSIIHGKSEKTDFYPHYGYSKTHGK